MTHLTGLSGIRVHQLKLYDLGGKLGDFHISFAIDMEMKKQLSADLHGRIEAIGKSVDLNGNVRIEGTRARVIVTIHAGFDFFPPALTLQRMDFTGGFRINDIDLTLENLGFLQGFVNKIIDLLVDNIGTPSWRLSIRNCSLR